MNASRTQLSTLRPGWRRADDTENQKESASSSDVFGINGVKTLGGFGRVGLGLISGLWETLDKQMFATEMGKLNRLEVN